MRRLLIGLALGGLLAGCTPGASGSVEPSGSATASVEASPIAQASCQPLALLLPSGEPLDLTGSWLGNDLGLYEIRQYGDCLWFVGQNQAFVLLFHGRVATDFTISGSWATVSSSRLPGDIYDQAAYWLGAGLITIQIESGSVGTNAEVVLRKLEGTDDPGFVPHNSINTSVWTKFDDEPDHPISAPS